MNDFTYKIGADYECDNKKYFVMTTKKGQQITVALTASGVPFKGQYDNDSIIFNYDRDYKESVDEIIEKITSDKFADIRREVDKYRNAQDYLHFIPAAAKLLCMTEGTLRSRPMDIQLAVCKRYADNWLCDTYTVQRELRDALSLITKPDLTDSEKDIAVGKD